MSQKTELVTDKDGREVASMDTSLSVPFCVVLNLESMSLFYIFKKKNNEIKSITEGSGKTPK